MMKRMSFLSFFSRRSRNSTSLDTHHLHLDVNIIPFPSSSSRLFFLFLLFFVISCGYLVCGHQHLDDETTSKSSSIYPWELPPIPSIEKLKAEDVKKHANDPNYSPPTKLIPNHLWITMREIPSEYSQLDYNIRDVMEINQDWHIHLTDDQTMNKFMNETFANTSLLWAFHLINPILGASKADIWRIAILWRYGGVYLDADSHIYTPLTQVIQPEDQMIIGTESHNYINFYHPDFILSKVTSSEVFGNHNIVQWLLISAPFHPFFTRTLENMVMTIKAQFMKKPVFEESFGELGERRLLATTGPVMVSTSIYQVLAEQEQQQYPMNLSYRWAGKDYAMYHAVFKAFKMPHDPNSYITKIHQGADLLVDYYHSTR